MKRTRKKIGSRVAIHVRGHGVVLVQVLVREVVVLAGREVEAEGESVVDLVAPGRVLAHTLLYRQAAVVL